MLHGKCFHEKKVPVCVFGHWGRSVLVFHNISRVWVVMLEVKKGGCCVGSEGQGLVIFREREIVKTFTNAEIGGRRPTNYIWKKCQCIV